MTEERPSKYVAFGPNRTYGIGYSVGEAIGFCRTALKGYPERFPEAGEPVEVNVLEIDAQAWIDGWGDIMAPEGAKQSQKVGRAIAYFNGSQGDRGDLLDALEDAAHQIVDYIRDFRQASLERGEAEVPEGVYEDLQYEVEQIGVIGEELYGEEKYSDEMRRSRDILRFGY